MVRNKLFILSILCSILFTQSCVHGDLEDCPPMVRYAVAFQYTNHTGEGDRFYDDVKKINLYVFDEYNLIYTTTTELSPYETNFNIPLDIPMGNYHIIAWGNVMDDQSFSVTPENFIKGETTLAEARLLLQREANNLSREELSTLFYGELNNVEIPLYISRIDTMSLTNNTNRVRVVLHWDHTKVLGSEARVDYNEVQVFMNASNAIYNFDNNFAGINNVVYKPYASYSDGKILETDPRPDEIKVNFYSDEIEEISDTTVYDISILRMMVNSPVNLTVERVKPAIPTPYNLATIDLVNSFIYYFDESGVSVSNRQYMFDKHDDYRIDIYFTYDVLADMYTTGGINIIDWKYVEQPDVPGAD